MVARGDSKPDTTALELARRVIDADADAVAAARHALDDRFVAAAEAMVACSGKVVVTGSGTSGMIARRAAHLLSVGGTPSFYVSPADGLHGGLGVLRQDDMILAISKGGGSGELNEFCRRGRTLSHCLIVITASPQSELARDADHTICLELEDTADLGTLVATGSSLAAAAVTDAFVEFARVARGYAWSEVLFTHPSGAVGRDGEHMLKRLGDR